MKPSLKKKLALLEKRQQELSKLLAEPEIAIDQQQFRELSKEYAELEPVVSCYRSYIAVQQDLADVEEMLNSEDNELKNLALEEIAQLQERELQLEQRIETLLLPSDPNDKRNVFLEIRAGTGGNEAALFAGDLCRMYGRYAEKRGWQFEILSSHEGEYGGYKEVIMRIRGEDVYSRLKFESGVHRVQRVPETESQGRIHTSACTVALFPEVAEIESVDLNPTELRIDTYRSQGAGGQHVNTTDSAVRITHIPTGTVVECQDERSQHKNKAKAMALLQAKILSSEREKQRRQQAETRRNLVGSGDRSERIRTYNFPQGRVTDHRINLTLYKLPEILEGNMDDIIETLIREHRADLLSALKEAEE